MTSLQQYLETLSVRFGQGKIAGRMARQSGVSPDFWETLPDEVAERTDLLVR